MKKEIFKRGAALVLGAVMTISILPPLASIPKVEAAVQKYRRQKRFRVLELMASSIHMVQIQVLTTGRATMYTTENTRKVLSVIVY